MVISLLKSSQLCGSVKKQLVSWFKAFNTCCQQNYLDQAAIDVKLVTVSPGMNVKEPEVDHFKAAFKRFKSYKGEPEEMINMRNPCKHSNVERMSVDFDTTDLDAFRCAGDFKHPSSWEAYTVTNVPRGLIIIPQILTEEASERWFQTLLTDIPQQWQKELQFNAPFLPTGDIDYDNLRWTTVGYHYNWKTKLYDRRGEIPSDISDISKFLSHVLRIKFTPEAGIINYYTPKSTLCPHSDHSEINHDVPLLSLSFGSPAVYLMGGKTRSSLPIVPIRLENSDLLIMSEESRLAFHAVPKVFGSTNNSGKKITRINLTIRQVY